MISWRAVMETRALEWTILIRLLVGLAHFPCLLGAGRFANIGIPIPELMGPLVGTVEIICRALIILGLLTRRGGAADHYHAGSDHLDEGADLAQSRFLDFSCAEAHALRFLEHGP
jgi:hypothetical protein